MINTNYIAGIGEGEMTDKYEIKILICYLLNTIQTPLSEDEINAIFQADNTVNYFNFCDALKELIDEKHLISKTNDDKKSTYILTESGFEISNKLSKSLPAALRGKIADTAIHLLKQIKIERENNVTISPCNNGFNVCCMINDEKFNILNFTMYMPDIELANLVKENFLKNPAEFYQKFLALLF